MFRSSGRLFVRFIRSPIIRSQFNLVKPNYTRIVPSISFNKPLIQSGSYSNLAKRSYNPIVIQSRSYCIKKESNNESFWDSYITKDNQQKIKNIVKDDIPFMIRAAVVSVFMITIGIPIALIVFTCVCLIILYCTFSMLEFIILLSQSCI